MEGNSTHWTRQSTVLNKTRFIMRLYIIQLSLFFVSKLPSPCIFVNPFHRHDMAPPASHSRFHPERNIFLFRPLLVFEDQDPK